LDFLGREGVLVGGRKQDFSGGNGEQRKGLKGKGRRAFDSKQQLQQNQRVQTFS